MSRPVILLIEDDETSRETFRLILMAEGYAIRAVGSAEEGLAALADCRPAAILLDQHLPLMNGLDCLRRLRERSVDTPVALLTADYFMDEGRASDFAALGAQIHFKPIWEADLLQILQGLLTRETAHGAR